MCKVRLAVLASVLAGLLLLAALPASASAEFSGGQYQREITVQENSGETLRDYQVLVALAGSDFPEEAQADGDDIRFTDADGVNLGYWIEEFDAGSKRAAIWVKVPLIPANGEAMITMWHGNPGAESGSDGEAVFEFFDDFEGVGLDSDKWSTLGTASVSGGNVLIGTSGGQDAQILTIPSYNKEKIVEVRAMGISGYHNNFFVGGSRVLRTNYVGAVRMGWDTIDIEHEPMSSIYDTRTSYVSDLGIWYRFQTAVYGDTIIAKVKLDTSPTWDADVSHRYPSGTLPSMSQIALVTDNSYSKFDWIRIRQYSASEPTISLAPPAPATHTALTITKSPTPHSIRQFQETTITISIENSGTTDATDIEITDTIHPGLDLTSGDFPNPKRYDLIRPGETRDLQYTISAKESGTFTLDPATVTYADEDGNIQEAKSEPASIKVIPSTEGGTAGDTSRSNPSVSTASVQLHGEKTNVVLGEDILLKLSAVNLITKPTMHVQVIIIPPSGMSVTSSAFAKSGAGQYTTTYELEPGTGKDIEVAIRSNQVGDFDVNGRIIYYFGDDRDDSEDHTLTLPITVRAEAGAERAASTLESEHRGSSTPGFAAVAAVIGLLAAYLRRKRS